MEELSPSPGVSAAASRWAPHGRLLSACLVALNVFLVLLVYFYFWRFFSRQSATDGNDAASAADESSPAVSPKARNRQEVERAVTALPVFVHSSSSSAAGAVDGTKSAVECAICIVEYVDGEEGRLLPRCGHRFHARCVDMWFHFHTSCPLCRTSVLPASVGRG